MQQHRTPGSVSPQKRLKRAKSISSDRGEWLEVRQQLERSIHNLQTADDDSSEPGAPHDLRITGLDYKARAPDVRTLRLLSKHASPHHRLSQPLNASPASRSRDMKPLSLRTPQHRPAKMGKSSSQPNSILPTLLERATRAQAPKNASRNSLISLERPCSTRAEDSGTYEKIR